MSNVFNSIAPHLLMSRQGKQAPSNHPFTNSAPTYPNTAGFNPWVPQPNPNPYTGSPFDPRNLGTPYYNPFTGAPHTTDWYQQDVPEEDDEDKIVEKVAQQVSDNSDKEERAKAAHAALVAEARKKWGANTPPGFIDRALDKLGLKDLEEEGWVEGNELTDGYWERNPLIPQSPLPGVSIAQMRKARQVLGVTPTGRAGNGPGDFDPSTGGVFNQYGVAVDPETGHAMSTANGSQSYATLKDWQDVRAAGNETGWRGGILTAAQERSLSATGRANYQRFKDQLAANKQAVADKKAAEEAAKEAAAKKAAEEAARKAAAEEAARKAAANAEAERVRNQFGGQSIRYDDDDNGIGAHEPTQHSINSSEQQVQETKQDGYSGTSGGFAGARNKGGLIAMNTGGMTMMSPMIARPSAMYYQEGGIADDGSNVNQGPPMIGGELPGSSLAPPMDPGMPTVPGQGQGMPTGDPMATMAPPMQPPRLTFAEKVEKARESIRGGASSVPKMHLSNTPMMADGEGDGGVMGDVSYSPTPVGPDMGPDTVDAKLTPGEYVVNKEATEKYLPQIEAMNQEGLEMRAMRNGGAVYANTGKYVGDDDVSAKLNRIRRLLDLPDLSPGNEARLKEMMDEMLSRTHGKAVYREEGGGIGQWARDNSDAIGRVGASLVHIGQNDFKGASDALKVPKGSSKEIQDKNDRIATLKESIDAAEKAKQFIDQGAGEVIDYRSRSLSNILAEADWDPSAYIGYAAAALNNERSTAINTVLHNKYGGTKQWNAYQAFEQEIRLLELKARALVKGGSISDAEAKAAAETIMTGSADANTTKQQLDTVISRNNKSLTNLGEKEYVSAASAFTVSGVGYKPGDGVSIGGGERVGGEEGGANPLIPTDTGTEPASTTPTVTPETIQEGQTFTSSDSTGTYDYTVISKDGKAYVTSSVGEYELNYDDDTQEWYINGWTGRTILTPSGG